MIRLHWYSLKRVHAWEYGRIGSGSVARRHIKTGLVEFAAWRGGYGSHALTSTWLRCDPSWDKTFIKNNS